MSAYVYNISLEIDNFFPLMLDLIFIPIFLRVRVLKFSSNFSNNGVIFTRKGGGIILTLQNHRFSCLHSFTLHAVSAFFHER